MNRQPQISADELRRQLQQHFDQLCQDITRAVNEAPPGHILSASEEKVRDLLANFRQKAYQQAIQGRLDAAQAAFPPSQGCSDRETASEQRT